MNGKINQIKIVGAGFPRPKQEKFAKKEFLSYNRTCVIILLHHLYYLRLLRVYD